MHHEVAEALAEQVRQGGGEIVVCGRDREHVLCELAEPLLEIGNDVARGPANCRNGHALSSHSAASCHFRTSQTPWEGPQEREEPETRKDVTGRSVEPASSRQ